MNDPASNKSVRLRPSRSEDASAIARIYNWYVANTTVTFEETKVSEEDMALRIEDPSAYCPWLVLEQEGRLLGYASSSMWKSRCAYRFARETSIYLDQDVRGQGLGIILYEGLLQQFTDSPINVLIAGIAQPNEASVALHEKLGFSYVGTFKDVGYKFEQLIDVGYWQKRLNNSGAGAGHQASGVNDEPSREKS